MSSQWSYEFPDISWFRKMMILLWCVFASFVTAVFLVTMFFYLFVPYFELNGD